jgi:hypothetical protein
MNYLDTLRSCLRIKLADSCGGTLAGISLRDLEAAIRTDERKRIADKMRARRCGNHNQWVAIAWRDEADFVERGGEE